MLVAWFHSRCSQVSSTQEHGDRGIEPAVADCPTPILITCEVDLLDGHPWPGTALGLLEVTGIGDVPLFMPAHEWLHRWPHVAKRWPDLLMADDVGEGWSGGPLFDSRTGMVGSMTAHGQAHPGTPVAVPPDACLAATGPRARRTAGRLASNPTSHGRSARGLPPSLSLLLGHNGTWGREGDMRVRREGEEFVCSIDKVRGYVRHFTSFCFCFNCFIQDAVNGVQNRGKRWLHF